MPERDNKTFAHNFLHIYRNVLMYIIVAVLLIGLFIIHLESSFVEKVQNEYQTIKNDG